MQMYVMTGEVVTKIDKVKGSSRYLLTNNEKGKLSPNRIFRYTFIHMILRKSIGFNSICVKEQHVSTLF